MEIALRCVGQVAKEEQYKIPSVWLLIFWLKDIKNRNKCQYFVVLFKEKNKHEPLEREERTVSKHGHRERGRIDEERIARVRAFGGRV